MELSNFVKQYVQALNENCHIPFERNEPNRNTKEHLPCLSVSERSAQNGPVAQ